MATPPVKKACDACHRRKVRCSGGQPCKNCGQASLQCTYLAIPQKKGPKGSRAKVISEIRDNQQQSTAKLRSNTTRYEPLATADFTSPTKSNSFRESDQTAFNFSTPPMSPTGHARNHDLLPQPMVDSCINFFFSHLYPTMPVYSQQKLTHLLAEYRNGSTEVYCLILAICAFIMIQPGIHLEGMPMVVNYEEDPAGARYGHAQQLLKEILRIRKMVDYIENPTEHSMQISFFLFCSYFTLDKSNQCWYYLREASTLAHITKMSEESTYRSGDAAENMYKRRFYWLLLVTERAYAMERHRPLSMLATVELPSVDDEPQEAPFMSGFLYLASLFRLIDVEFMALWNKEKAECSTVYLSELQQQLADVLPAKLECTENQAADVRITQHWLRTMVWQLSISNGYLSSNSNDTSMTFKYPIQIAKDLVRDIQTLSLQSMEVHGVGLIEKLFDMSCTLSDVIACVPMDQVANGLSDNPQEYLNQLLNLISRLRGGASRYVPLLMAKVAENIPNMQNPLSHMPASLDAFIDGAGSHTSSPHAMGGGTNQHTPQAGVEYAAGGGVIRPPPFGDIHQSPLQPGLMFDAYSPSAGSHADTPMMTPPVPGLVVMNYQQQLHPQTVPRSVPISQPQQGFNG